LNAEQPATAAPRRRRLKWEPAAALISLIAVSLWVVYDPSKGRGEPVQIGNVKGVLAAVDAGPGQPLAYQFEPRSGQAGKSMTAQEVELYFGKEVRESLQQTRRNVLFRMFKVSSWGNLLWVGLGLAGQAAFSGRMLIQWIVSEKSRKSVVPAAFWYLSLFGALALFAYFVWRQDAVGVLGQAPGLVIYIRNLRLLAKQKRRAARVPPGAAT
jgi:lipid-A-disaccharide synthase-like uncharacterized protein